MDTKPKYLHMYIFCSTRAIIFIKFLSIFMNFKQSRLDHSLHKIKEEKVKIFLSFDVSTTNLMIICIEIANE